MDKTGCRQEDYNGGNIAYDRQHSNKENKNLTTGKVHLTWQQSTKIIGEHIHRQEKSLIEEEISPNRNEDHCIAEII